MNEPMYQGPGAIVEGDVRLGKDVTIWHNAVIRTEEEPIEIGDDSNIQDGCILHTDAGFPISIGKNVSLGHGAIVHGAVVENDCLIGMGAVVMNGAKIGTGSIVAAGALVPEGKQIPPHSVAAGVPAKILRAATEEDQRSIVENATHYVELGRRRKSS